MATGQPRTSGKWQCTCLCIHYLGSQKGLTSTAVCQRWPQFFVLVSRDRIQLQLSLHPKTPSLASFKSSLHRLSWKRGCQMGVVVVVVVQARKMNKEDAIDRCKWRKMIKDVRWSGRVWVGECFFWYRPTRVVPDQRPLNGCVCVVVVVQFQLNDKRLVLAKNQFIQAQNIKLLIKKWWLKNVEIDIIIILEQLSSLFLPAS